MSVTLSSAAMDLDEMVWKTEPLSPDLGSLEVETDNWLFNDDDVAEQLYHTQHEKPFIPVPANRSEVAAKLLQDLNDWIKEEPFPEWMEEKGDFGIFESLPLETSDLAISEAVKKLPVERKEEVSNTSFLLQEFQSIYDQLEQDNSSLTPPLSPTLPSYTNVYNVASSFVVSTPLQFIEVTPVGPVSYACKKDPIVVPVSFAGKKLEEPIVPSFEQIVPVTPSTDLVDEMTVVDELVRMCANKMVPDVEESGRVSQEATVENFDQESLQSQDSESDTVVLYNFPLSPGMSCSGSSGDEDPDYAPSIVSDTSGTSGKTSRGKKRSAKDYISSPPEEKKQRKKEQNKNAATRYRKKKKAEVEEILGEEKELEVKNDELNKQVDDLNREIRYLKGFIRDVFKAKGLIQ